MLDNSKMLIYLNKIRTTNKSVNFIRNYSKLNSNVIDSIKSIFGQENYSISESVRQHHAKDESLHQ